MKHRTMKWMLITVALAMVLVAGGCKKKAASAAAPPSAPPPPPQPTATLSVSPLSIEHGQSATLTWSTQNATTVTIEGIGNVQASGSQAVSPATSTTYRLAAQGEGGSADATARLTVTEPAPPPAPLVGTEPAGQDLAATFASAMKDIYFDYDRYELRPEDQAAIASDAAFLRSHPQVQFTIQGHCDERGSTDYNLELGDSRANAAREALVKAGVSPSQIKTISYGKERPFCNESTEACWQQNRRAHFVFGH